MNPSRPIIPILIVAFIFAIGTYWALQKGGQDFNVFYEAWRLVLEGRAHEIYVVSPDRYLYAPGFAWFLSPFALLPFSIGLLVWTLGKALALGSIIRVMSQALPRSKVHAFWPIALGFVIAARPTLIELRYGQINFYLLACAFWALWIHLRNESSLATRALAWGALGILAIAKLILLPLLLVPWLTRSGGGKRGAWTERGASIAGVLLILLLPIATEGIRGNWELLLSWKVALAAKGFPTDSHNQSFAAVIYHYFSGLPTQAIVMGESPIQLGWPLLSLDQITWLGLAWSCISLGLIFAWILRASEKPPLQWTVVLVGMLIVPSHLVWKPYFALTFPIAAWVFARAFAESDSARRTTSFFALGALFLVANCTGVDVLGRSGAARVDAAGVLFWSHLALLIWCARSRAPLTGQATASA